MDKNKDKKGIIEKLNKPRKWLFTIITLLLAIFIALTIILGIKYSNYKHDVTSGESDGTFVLLIDDNGDRTPDHTYTFHGNYKGITLEKFLKDDVTNDDLKFYITYTPLLGGFLDTIKIKEKSYPKSNSFFWEIDSATSKHGTGPNGMTDVGMSGLILDSTNVYTFSYQAIH